MERTELVAWIAIAGATLNFGWTVLRDVTGSRSAERSAAAAEASAQAADGSRAAAERSAAAAEERVSLERRRDEESRRARVRPLFWNSTQAAPRPGLVIQNDAAGVARGIVGWRFIPSGRGERAELPGSIGAGATVSIRGPWAEIGAPTPGWPTDGVPEGKYFARVTWEDESGGSGDSGWVVVDKH